MSDNNNYSFLDNLIGDDGDGNGRIWSMEEIDALLNGEALPDEEPKDEEPREEKKEEEVKKDEPVITEKTDDGQIGLTVIDIPEEDDEEAPNTEDDMGLGDF